MDVDLNLEFFDDGNIQKMRILVSLLTLGIAFATNDRYGPGWNWLINLTFFECIIPVFLGNFGSEMLVNLNPLLVHSMVLLGVTLSSLSALIASGNSSDQDQIESVMLGQFEPIKETAVDYFLRIFSGNETGATVVWPQRLKVGAKKGKNPQITICGLKYEGGHRSQENHPGTLRVYLDKHYNAENGCFKHWSFPYHWEGGKNGQLSYV